ncbi:serine protease [Leisingera sp. ANG59]|uniref:trypsin-like serine peptidase n=1 Tax=Leisingera sp. ANG59 TaxID=2675221 RepID=UPI0015722276|nr:trypsin-like serine protease [Leisingera sp. ANG59]NSY40999.1 trypsin-like serine protease [Leisingera sp. ANG59]
MNGADLIGLINFATRFILYFSLLIAPNLAISEHAIQKHFPEIKQAIVQLHIGGRNFCTGTLVTPYLVATAAHCIANQHTKAVFRPEAVLIYFRLRQEKLKLTRRAKQVVTHPNYRFGGPDESNLRADIAFLLLDQPVPEDVVKPIPITGRFRRQERVSILSYSQHSRRNLRIDNECKVLGFSHHAVAFSCKVDFGESGAPVIGWGEDQTPSLVSIITAKAMMGEEPVALGAILDETAVSVFRDASCASEQPGPC